ncbi:actin-binding protein IPP isoform X2 [Carcharodon carcharias]|uniref:actin-binding protein IPP isoform X2 n=1 Tax=Carcharodon carcharias TaxID=13397 RepID=UPI001B7F6757|nr:actin-binding protein IPP isoform X2 [Carcharodon carcharias]
MAHCVYPKPGSSPAWEPGRSACDKHARALLAQINRMRARADFCDVQLQVEEQLFSVHKLILAASSPYFAVLFAGGMQEASKKLIQIHGIEAETFRLLLEFIYTGIINVSIKNVQEVILAADMLQLTEIVNMCSDFLKGQVDPSNCVGIYQFAEQIACHDLIEFSESYIYVHFLEACKTEEFMGLEKDQLVKILKSEELHIEDEYQVFTTAMEWVLKDMGKRKKYVIEVLDPVRFPLLSSRRLFKYIEGIPDFSLRVALQKLLEEYREVSKPQKETKFCKLSPASKIRPRRKARKYLYAIGGYTRLQGGRWSDSRTLSCVERFDSFSQYWTTVSSLHQARSGLGVAVLEGMIYVIGGESDSMIFDCAERYDPVTKQWAAVASMNSPRCGLAVCACHAAIYALGLIYVVGGLSDSGSELRSAEMFNPITKRWTTLDDMKTKRAYVGVAALNDCVYAVGGWNETQNALRTAEKYSLQEEKWFEVSPMKMARAGVSVIAVNGLLYAVGGRTSGRDSSAPVTLDSVEVYDPHTDTWMEIGNMITSRCDGGVAVL